MPTRRALFRTLLFGGILALGGRRKALGMVLFDRPQRKGEPVGGETPYKENGRSLLAVAKDPDPERALDGALELLGGLGPLKPEGKRVLVKPNVVSGRGHPTTNNPAVVSAVVRRFYEAGAAEVVVGDMSALLASGTSENLEETGIAAAAEAAGAQVAAFEDGDWIEVPLPKARYVQKALVSDYLYRADLLINLPVLKTHRSASYSICLKNFIGCTHPRQRPYLVDSDHWEELVAEFNLAWRPQLNLVDATTAMVAGGPWSGESRRTDLIIASGDRVAADILGLGIISTFGQWPAVTQKDVWQQRQIRRALELGLGAGRGEIELRAAGEGREFRELMAQVRQLTGLGS